MEDSIALAIPATEGPLLSTRMAEEGRLCPLCKSEIRLFFINFNEKMLMCENVHCEFPFGYEELQFFKEDNDVGFDAEVFSIQTKSYRSPTATASIISTSAWSEIDRLNRTCDTEDPHYEMKPTSSQESNKEKKMENVILKHVNEIKELNKELLCDTNKVIKNEKWIKNLKTIQEISGVQLLKPQELGLLKKEEPNIGLGELKIDIAPGNENCMSSIMIEICNKPDDNDSKETGKDP